MGCLWESIDAKAMTKDDLQNLAMEIDFRGYSRSGCAPTFSRCSTSSSALNGEEVVVDLDVAQISAALWAAR
ncbi:hypothetical protein AB0M44_36185 [Streptosporangium subroseum]|uniref:hypothetical protein n=1 Tax=Streptosporangium subroseum TaxID=106412 RepID=UPI003441A509